jgi:hypothetical protein
VSPATASVELLITTALLLCSWAAAQPDSCRDGEVVSKPGRPAMTNGADPTRCGVLELEYGFEHNWARDSRGRSLAGGLRFGIAPDLDFHWSAEDFQAVTDRDGGASGYGDNWLGFAYRYLKQTKSRPSLGVMYTAKIPTGDPDRDLGSGEVDHSLSFLVSKDMGRLHVDINATPQWIGVSHSAPGHNVALSMAGSFPVHKRLTLVLESYGETAVNPATAAYASLMTGCSLQVHPRLYVDAGFDAGITAAAPHKRVFAGFTVAATNLYTAVSSTRR